VQTGGDARGGAVQMDIWKKGGAAGAGGTRVFGSQRPAGGSSRKEAYGAVGKVPVHKSQAAVVVKNGSCPRMWAPAVPAQVASAWEAPGHPEAEEEEGEGERKRRRRRRRRRRWV